LVELGIPDESIIKGVKSYQDDTADVDIEYIDVNVSDTMEEQ